MISNIVCGVISLCSFGISIGARERIKDLELESAPRVFYDVKDKYSQPLILLQVLILCADSISLGFALRSFLTRNKKNEVTALEHSPLANYIFSQIFLILTKGLAIIITVLAVSLCLVELGTISQDYQYSQVHDNTLEDIAFVESLLNAIMWLQLVNFSILSVSCSLGFFKTGTKAFDNQKLKK